MVGTAIRRMTPKGLAGTLLAFLVLSLASTLGAGQSAAAPIDPFVGNYSGRTIITGESGISERDLAVTIEKAGKGLVADLELFDLYRGANLEPGQKSLAWHLCLRAADRTLGEGDVARFLGRLERAAEAAGCSLRRD